MNYDSLAATVIHRFLERLASSLQLPVEAGPYGTVQEATRLYVIAGQGSAFVALTTNPHAGWFHLVISREQPVDKRTIEHLVEQVFGLRDSLGRKVVQKSHLLQEV